MGFANLLADAISMGLGDFISSKVRRNRGHQGAGWVCVSAETRGTPPSHPSHPFPMPRLQAELEFEVLESTREKAEFKAYPEEEIAEHAKLLVERGVSEEDALNVSNVLARYPDVFHEVRGRCGVCVRSVEPSQG